MHMWAFRSPDFVGRASFSRQKAGRSKGHRADHHPRLRPGYSIGSCYGCGVRSPCGGRAVPHGCPACGNGAGRSLPEMASVGFPGQPFPACSMRDFQVCRVFVDFVFWSAGVFCFSLFVACGEGGCRYTTVLPQQ